MDFVYIGAVFASLFEGSVGFLQDFVYGAVFVVHPAVSGIWLRKP